MGPISSRKNNNLQHGFTLVELSIVIVIIGLIVSGVVAGQSLIRQGRLIGQVTELQKYDTAFNAFKVQYNAIPGDFENAGNYWAGTPGGNGNRYLDNNGDTFTADMEGFLLFEHLSRAQLIEGTYDATPGTFGVTIPKLKIDSKKGMSAGNATNPSAAATVQLSNAQGSERHWASLYLEVGRPTVALGTTMNEVVGVASPRSFQLIDQKIDDGVARTGRIRAFLAASSTQGNCLTGVDGDYLIANELPACNGEFILK